MSVEPTLSRPRTGDEFVWMPASAGEWREITHRVYEVQRGDEWGVWSILYQTPPIHRPPPCFTEQYGADFGAARIEPARIVWRDGRWFAVHAHPSHVPMTMGCVDCGAAWDDVESMDAPCPNARCPRCGNLYGCCGHDQATVP